MKKITEIKQQLQNTEKELEEKKQEYKKLSQIACLDSHGRLLEEQINGLKGKIEMLKWVLS